MKLLMISGDRSVLQGKLGAFFYTLQEMRKHWERIDIIYPHVPDSTVTMSESGHRFIAGSHEGGEVFFHACPKSLLFQIPWIINRGKALIRQHKHEVMTVHDYAPFYNGIGAKRLHTQTKVPYATEIHHIVGWPVAASISERFGRLMSWLFLPFVVRKAKAIRVVNYAVERKLISWGVPRKKIWNISSFYLDADMLSPKHKPPVSYDVSFCGRLVANKGLGELIDAVATLHSVRLLIIGDGPERKRMEDKVAELHIGNRVTFLGWLPTQEAVSGAIQTARIFVMCSKSEGGPRVALEAMGCGMPVIVTKVGVMPEVVRDDVNGVFTTGKSSDLAAKIEHLLNNEKKRDSLGHEAKKVLDKYERSRLIKQYAEFLKGLA